MLTAIVLLVMPILLLISYFIAYFIAHGSSKPVKMDKFLGIFI